MEQIKITGTVGAYLTSSYAIECFQRAMKEGKHDEAVDELSFSRIDMSAIDRWIRVGDAQITLTMLPSLNLVNEQVRNLEAMLQEERAESMKRQQALLAQISKLQAIEYAPQEEPL
jgi:hypothetical protein